MKAEEEFLKSDFDQCCQFMRHYDSHFLTIVNFIFGGYAAVIVAAIAFLASKANQSVVLCGSSILFFFSWVAGSLLLSFLLRNRVYFTAVARYVNEIRGNYLASKPIGFENATGLPCTEKTPPLFSFSSTHMVLMYFIALVNSGFLGTSIAALTATFTTLPTQQINISWGKPLIIFTISAVAELLWIIIYLKRKESIPATQAWWGRRSNK